MKSTLVIFALILSGTVAHAFDANCTATAVYDSSYLEEGLSTDEYPEVTVTDDEVWLGSSFFSLDNGDVIEMKPSVGFEQTIEVSQAGGEQTFVISINHNPVNKTGTISVKNKGKIIAKIADLVCE